MTKLIRIRDRFMKQRSRLSKDLRLQKACTRLEFRSHAEKGSNGNVFMMLLTNVDIIKECDCSPETILKRRYRRFRREHEKINIQRIATIAQLDEEGEIVYLDEILQRYWEDEFLRYIQEKEVMENGEWYQGVLENRNDGDIRIKRSLKMEKARIGSLCVRYNMSVICKPKVFRDSKLWTIHKAKVDGRIENLKRKLLLYKDMRRTLKRRRPSVLNDFSSSYDLNRCICRETHARLLRDEINSTDMLWRKMEKVFTAICMLGNSNHDELHANCTVPQMNCFVHGADHWRTPPFWPERYGQFCFCQNSNNNTYWCLRTVNTTHNFLYCEFITEFISYYDLNADPYQLHNIIWSIPLGVLEQLNKQLEFLRTCRGYAQCEHYSSPTWYLPFMKSDSVS
ncbi:Extracellular sulfatase Sulf-1 [Dirofilaria immitis]|nr:Extracellular sulfatase Sulf-1 [Dirofilaria immitis]